MNIYLKPCPFCGGEAEFGGGDYGDGHSGYWVECKVCGTTDPLPNLSWSMEEVAAAWNTRAERTCRKLPSSGEKECTVTHIGTGMRMAFGYWKCSECGCECFEGARYCMGCGAKVVEG